MISTEALVAFTIRTYIGSKLMIARRIITAVTRPVLIFMALVLLLVPAIVVLMDYRPPNLDFNALEPLRSFTLLSLSLLTAKQIEPRSAVTMNNSTEAAAE